VAERGRIDEGRRGDILVRVDHCHGPQPVEFVRTGRGQLAAVAGLVVEEHAVDRPCPRLGELAEVQDGVVGVGSDRILDVEHTVHGLAARADELDLDEAPDPRSEAGIVVGDHGLDSERHIVAVHVHDGIGDRDRCKDWRRDVRHPSPPDVARRAKGARAGSLSVSASRD
jgi:hypothetical protein